MAVTPGGLSFDRLVQRLVRTGMLAGPGEVLMLASSLPGEGVSTLATGLADACAAQLTRPVTLISAGAETAGAPFDGLGGRAQRRGYALPLDPVRWSETLGQLRARHGAVIVDAGSLSGEAPGMWRPLVDRALLVIDMTQARREALKRLGEELGRSIVRFDGFVANRKLFFIPNPVFSFLEGQGSSHP